MGSYCLMGIEFQFCKMKRVLEMDAGNGFHNNKNLLNTTEVAQLRLPL